MKKHLYLLISLVCLPISASSTPPPEAPSEDLVVATETAGPVDLGDSFQLTWYSVESVGGHNMDGSGFDLVGTLGEIAADPALGGPFKLRSGFLSVVTYESSCLSESAIFCDGFETGDTSRWNLEKRYGNDGSLE